MLNAKSFILSMLLSTFCVSGMTAAAQDVQWRVAKVSGEAWIGAAGTQQASLARAPALRPGDTIRTGRNGRVLLLRGAESLLISANSSITLPEPGRSGMTTLIQQAGTILLDVEKRNVQHFEVETPYLAAVVKGTQFRVSIRQGRAQVNVTRGQVQVSDLRSGQFALVMPGQSARSLAGGPMGLQLSGQGTLSPIQQGAPQAPSVPPVPVPGRGLGPLPGAVQIQPAAAFGPGPVSASAPGVRTLAPGIQARPGGVMRISAPIGEVNLDIHKVTRGMARGDHPGLGNAGPRATVWSTGELNPGNGGSKNKAVNSGAAGGTSETSAGASGAAASTGQPGGRNIGITAAQGNGGGNNGNAGGKGNTGSKGHDNSGGNGNGNSGGNGNGNPGGNGNGNSGGNGNGNSGGNGNGNSGGNGNGNSGGNGNGNSGGNGNGNSGGNGNGNSGGNGNGNSGGNGNGNPGGNGNGNSGGNGNSNAGGNGNSGGSGNSGTGNPSNGNGNKN
jgi:hypothetical protein